MDHPKNPFFVLVLDFQGKCKYYPKYNSGRKFGIVLSKLPFLELF